MEDDEVDWGPVMSPLPERKRAAKPQVRTVTARSWSPAREHADSVWLRLRMAAAGDDLRFIGMLAAHVVACQLCKQRWVSGDAPVLYLERRLSTSRVRDIWKAACVQEQALDQAG